MSRTLALVAAILLGATTTAAAAGKPLSSKDILSQFVGKPFTWKHKSGAGGSTIHNADGSMTYDTHGKSRTAKWQIKGKDFCVNAGESDEWCFRLHTDGKVFTSADGSIVYTPR